MRGKIIGIYVIHIYVNNLPSGTLYYYQHNTNSYISCTCSAKDGILVNNRRLKATDFYEMSDWWEISNSSFSIASIHLAPGAHYFTHVNNILG